MRNVSIKKERESAVLQPVTIDESAAHPKSNNEIEIGVEPANENLLTVPEPIIYTGTIKKTSGSKRKSPRFASLDNSNNYGELTELSGETISNKKVKVA